MATKDISDLQVCEAVRDSWENNRQPRPDEILEQRTGQHPKVVERALERAVNRQLLDYGVSLRGVWLTEKGKALLDANGDALQRRS